MLNLFLFLQCMDPQLSIINASVAYIYIYIQSAEILVLFSAC